MEQEERKIVLDLNRDIAIQSTACGRNCRHVVYAIIGVSWGFFLNEEKLWSRLLFSIIMLMGIAYLMVETWRYYSTAKKARRLYNQSESLDDKTINREMKKQSEWAFVVLFKQMLLCGFMTIAIAVYVLMRYVV